MGANHQHQPSNPLIRKLLTRGIFALLPLILLHFYLSPLNPQIPPSQIPQSPNPPQKITRCNLSDGRWIPDDRLAPLYNGSSCSTIKPGQNCMAHGRPDSNYLRYRWQPNNCHLAAFRPAAFLQSITNRHLAFVGDSMARNQLESLLCLLSAAATPQLTYADGPENKFRRWVFASHNATISIFWSPFLVKGVEKSESIDHNELHLDSADERWSSDLGEIDIIVFSAGHWFLHPAVYYEGGGAVLGCHHCPGSNHTEVGFFEVFGRAVRTAVGEVVRRRRGTAAEVVVVTFSPAHFEGEWDKLGACARTAPYREGERAMEYMDAEMRRVAVEAAKGEEDKGIRVRVLDVTGLAFMRPDGHPGPYMYPDPFGGGGGGPKDRVQNDCVHWCLPGPIDMWNQILLQMIQQQ